MEPGIIIALFAGIFMGIYHRSNNKGQYILRNRTFWDDLLGN